MKKTITGILAASIVATALTGCSPQNNGDTDVADVPSDSIVDTITIDTSSDEVTEISLENLGKSITIEERYALYQNVIKKAQSDELQYILEEDFDTYKENRSETVNQALYWLYDGNSITPHVGTYNYIATEGSPSRGPMFNGVLDIADPVYEYMTDAKTGNIYRMLPQMSDYDLRDENEIERDIYNWAIENTVFDDISLITFRCSYNVCATENVDIDKLNSKTVLLLLSEISEAQRDLAKTNNRIDWSYGDYTVLINFQSLPAGTTKEQCDKDLKRLSDEFSGIVGGWGMSHKSYGSKDSAVWMSYYPEDDFYASTADYWTPSFAELDDGFFADMLRAE